MKFRKNMANYAKAYKHAWQTFGQSWPVRWSFVLITLKNAAKFIALPIALSQVVAAISAQDFDKATSWAIFFLVFSATIGVIAPLVKYVGRLGESVVYEEIVSDYFTKLVSADIEYFNSNLSGYLTTATRQYSDSVVLFVCAWRDSYLQTLLSVLFPIAVMLWVNVWLGLIIFAIFVVQTGYIVWSSHRVAPYRTATREFYKKHSGVMADIISNILTVKATGKEQVHIDKVSANTLAENLIYQKRYLVQAKMIAGREAVTVLIYAVFLWAVLYMASIGTLNLASTVLVVTYITTVLNGAYTLGDQFSEHDDWVDKILPAFDVLERENRVADPAKPQKFADIRGEISLNDVAFAYDTGPVLKNFSLNIPAGQKVGVVGLSGAGKSTLTKLLLRFADVSSGAVTVDGIDVRSVRQSDLRSKIAYVPQEPMLFHSSVRDNVAVAHPGASDEQIEQALRTAHAWPFVKELPHGMNSIVGERGVKLSGGQKQRVVIARAVLQNSPIIVLDEATSALDSESEQIIKQSFREVLKGKTAIVVAHRLSTLSDMDRIIFIKNGTVTEDGTHDELLALNGAYARMWRRQERYAQEA